MSFARWLRWRLCLVLPVLVMGHNSTKAGDILGTMLGASPPAPPPLAEIAPELVNEKLPVATVAPVIQTPPPLSIVPNAPACTTDLSTLIFIVTNVAKYITWSTQYCAQPNEVSTICANYVVGIIRNFLSTASVLSSAVFTCGNIQATCSEVIIGAIKGVVSAVQLAIIMEITCFDDVLCAYLAVRFISALLHAAKNIETAMISCPIDDGDGDDDGDGPGRLLLEAEYGDGGHAFFSPALRYGSSRASVIHPSILPVSAYGLE